MAPALQLGICVAPVPAINRSPQLRQLRKDAHELPGQGATGRCASKGVDRVPIGKCIWAKRHYKLPVFSQNMAAILAVCAATRFKRGHRPLLHWMLSRHFTFTYYAIDYLARASHTIGPSGSFFHHSRPKPPYCPTIRIDF